LVTGFLNATVESRHRSMPYVVYVPRDYTPKKRWPVILFLHGSGECGDNGLSQTQTGIGRALRLHPERFPCLVVMPQAPSGDACDWSGAPNDLALQALDEVVRRYRGDRGRLYLTGLSMGGFGCFRIAAAHPDRLAAVLPICGGGDPQTITRALKSLPIWVFHGGADTVVLPERSREMVDAIRAAGNRLVRYTEYPDVGHNSWDATYDDPDVIAWLLAQQRRGGWLFGRRAH
jgi:predicted peptidase